MASVRYRLRRPLWIFSIFAVVCFMLPAIAAAQDAGSAPAAPASPADVDERQIRDWTLRCAVPPGQPVERCEMVQQVLGSDGTPMMVVAVGRIDGADDPGMLMLVPLGISLTAGIKLSIDDGPEIDLRVERCERPGCRIEQILTPDILARLKAGNEARITFLAIDPEGRYQPGAISFSLLGFTAAVNEILS